MSQGDKQVREALELALDGFEAVITKLRQDLSITTKKEAKPHIDLAKINWKHNTLGTAGYYSLAREDENKDNPEYDALSKLLEENRGKMTVDGNFAWLFPDGTAIGMKPRKKATA